LSIPKQYCTFFSAHTTTASSCTVRAAMKSSSYPLDARSQKARFFDRDALASCKSLKKAVLAKILVPKKRGRRTHGEQGPYAQFQSLS
jgi:hypothetical protein